MRIADVVPETGGLWLKSEYAPLSSEWPALSFTRKAVATQIARDFQYGRDVVVLVGTGNDDTPDPSHRGRLLSVVEPLPDPVVPTPDLVPERSWAEAQNKARGRWKLSLPISRLWKPTAEPLPRAKAVAPHTYPLLGQPYRRGFLVPVDAADRAALLNIEIEAVALMLSPRAERLVRQSRLGCMPPALRKEATRMADWLLARASIAPGTGSVGRDAAQRMSDLASLASVVAEAWYVQRGVCVQCGRPMLLTGGEDKHRALPVVGDMSPGWHARGDLRIVHKACLARV
uniref:hypothetical protein n=1 Tax=Azospirillum argentinense TaxID=2970906 RepID=UPI0010C0465B|nr:hypothetical protein [Azospirillum argentinense]